MRPKRWSRRQIIAAPFVLGVAPARRLFGAGRKPNVIFILLDDLGYGDIGSYGVTDIRTPHLDRMAHQGVRLTNNYSNGPVCTPTRAAFVTGRYQQRVGLEWAIPPAMKEPGLPASETSVARMVKDNGYATALFGKWHLGYKPEFGPNAHGFDEFFGILSGNVDHYAHREINGEPDLYENTQPVERPGYMTDLITERSVDFINRRARDSFFLYVAYNAVHWPFQPPDRPDDIRTRETWLRGTRRDYALMMERVDQGIGRILAALDRHGLARDTLVIFTDDNGGERLSRNWPLFHHKATLWEGGIRVPGLLRWPGRLPAGTISHQPAMTMDMTATILSATGISAPAGRTPDGMDLLPILTRRRPPVERAQFWRIERAGRNQRAVRKGKWKYLRDAGVEMLFDLERDVGERLNLGYRHPELLAELRQSVREWEKEMDSTPPAFKVK